MLWSIRELGKDAPVDLFLRDPDKTWAIIEVAKIGRRPMRVSQIGWTYRRKKHGLPSTFYSDGQWLPTTIDEGEARDFPVDDAHVEGVLCVWARTAARRADYGDFKRSLTGAFYRLWTALGFGISRRLCRERFSK